MVDSNNRLFPQLWQDSNDYRGGLQWSSHARTFGVTNAVQHLRSNLGFLESSPNQRKDMLVVVHRRLPRQESMTWRGNVSVTRVGEDGPILSHNSDPYLVGRTLESHCNHPSCNTLHLSCSHQPYPAISYKTAKTNSAREQGERSSKCDGEIRVRSSIGTLLGESGRGFCNLMAIFFSKSDFFLKTNAPPWDRAEGQFFLWGTPFSKGHYQVLTFHSVKDLLESRFSWIIFRSMLHMIIKNFACVAITPILIVSWPLICACICVQFDGWH
jgi:hypothetical protein